MFIKVDVRSLVEELEWIEAATEKEIEDEKLALNDELDEIAWQLRGRGNTDRNWYFRAIHASKHKRKKLELIKKLRDRVDVPVVDSSVPTGILKHELDVLKSKNGALKAKVSKLQEKLEKRRRIIFEQGRLIKIRKDKLNIKV